MSENQVLVVRWHGDLRPQPTVKARIAQIAWVANSTTIRLLPFAPVIRLLLPEQASLARLVADALIIFLAVGVIPASRIALGLGNRWSAMSDLSVVEDDRIEARVTAMAFVREGRNSPPRVDRGVLAVIDGRLVFVGSEESVSLDIAHGKLEFGRAPRFTCGYDVCAEFTDGSFARFRILAIRESRARRQAIFEALKSHSALKGR